MENQKSAMDCLFIGHNEMRFVDYEKEVRNMGSGSGAYRDLNLNFIRYNNKAYSASDIFNLFNSADSVTGAEPEQVETPLSLGNNFSAAIAYLGTYLARRGLTFDYVNGFQEGKDELAEKLKNPGLRTIAIITTLYVSVFPILEIMEFIKKYNETAQVIVGGPFVATQCRKLEPSSLSYLLDTIGADVYVNSPKGEQALVEVIRAVKENTSLEHIDNIHYKNNGGYTATSVSAEHNRLSENMVDWELFGAEKCGHISLRTAVSCPFSCSFCGFPGHAGKYDTADEDAVERELEGLVNSRGGGRLKGVSFIDDTFNVPMERFKEILRRIIKIGGGFKWNSHFRCQFADRETVELMKESGCEGVFLGIESGSNRILKNMNKAATVEKYRHGIELLKEYGILSYGSFIVGFPGETEDTVGETIDFIKNSGLDFFRAQLWYCDTETPIWGRRNEFGISGSNFEWKHATMDSHRACDIVEEIFLGIDEPLWIPQYNFECDGLFQMLHRGFTLEETVGFIRAFNLGIKEKIQDPSRKEIGFEAIMQIKKACKKGALSSSQPVEEKEKTVRIPRAEVDFDF